MAAGVWTGCLANTALQWSSNSTKAWNGINCFPMQTRSAFSTLPLSPDSRLDEAFCIYLNRRKFVLKRRSIDNYRFHFRYLIKFFGPEKRLETFHEGSFRDYQQSRSRSEPDHSAAGPSCIYHELNALAQVLELADLWHPIRKYYEPLPLRNWAPPRVLTSEEEERFFRFAGRKPAWKTAYCASQITSNSAISGCELRFLQIKDLILQHQPPVIQVPEAAKNQHRVRRVPLNATALKATMELVQIAATSGATRPEHYLVPFRVKRGKYDPSRPASEYFIRCSFRSIARSCGLPWVTPRTFRHQAITKLLEKGAPGETVRAIAGHVSEKAMRYYSHIRIEAKNEALGRLEEAPRKKSTPPGERRMTVLDNMKTVARRLRIPGSCRGIDSGI